MTTANDLECLDGPDGCSGPVTVNAPNHRCAPVPRCERHFARRCERERRILELEAPCPPDWFDPLDAGESWDEP